MTTYTIERMTLANIGDKEFVDYMNEAAPKLTELFDNTLDWRKTDYVSLITKCHFMVCKKDGEIVGHSIFNFTNSPLDTSKVIARMISIYTKRRNSRAAYLLFNNFIDIGKDRANHIIISLARQSNINPSTLERYGFKTMETLYRMEIK